MKAEAASSAQLPQEYLATKLDNVLMSSSFRIPAPLKPLFAQIRVHDHPPIVGLPELSVNTLIGIVPCSPCFLIITADSPDAFGTLLRVLIPVRHQLHFWLHEIDRTSRKGQIVFHVCCHLRAPLADLSERPSGGSASTPSARNYPAALRETRIARRMPIHNCEPNRTTNGDFSYSRDLPDEPLTAVKVVLVTLFMRRGDSKHVRSWSIFPAVKQPFGSGRSS